MVCGGVWYFCLFVILNVMKDPFNYSASGLSDVCFNHRLHGLAQMGILFNDLWIIGRSVYFICDEEKMQIIQNIFDIL